MTTTTCTAPRHGTAHFYRKYGCRCPDAIEASQAWARQRAAERPRACRPFTINIDDYDEIAVVRALRGDMSITLTCPELTEAVARLDRLRLSARQIAVRLGITMRTVNRHRARRAANAGAAASPDRRAVTPLAEHTYSAQHRNAGVRQGGVAA